jgi:hypothetical protein
MIWLFLACVAPGGDATPDDSAATSTQDTAQGTAGPMGAQQSGPVTMPHTDGVLSLCVNELMADNAAALLTAEGATPDWIELHNPTAEAVSLAGWRLGDDPAEAQPLPELWVEAGGFLLLYADGEPELGPEHLDFRLASDGDQVALYDPDGDGERIRFGHIEPDFSLARTQDCCPDADCWTHRFRGTPGAPNRSDGLWETALLAQGATWSYWAQAASPGLDWAQPGHDDASWPRGAAPLGYGDAHIATVIDGGPPEARHRTEWFRVAFEAEAADALWASVLMDDGAAVYLNGQEVLRANLPEGPLLPRTLANAEVTGTLETAWRRVDLDPALLVEGRNVIAVEVHQATDSSDDLGFGLALSSGLWVGSEGP